MLCYRSFYCCWSCCLLLLLLQVSGHDFVNNPPTIEDNQQTNNGCDGFEIMHSKKNKIQSSINYQTNDDLDPSRGRQVVAKPQICRVKRQIFITTTTTSTSSVTTTTTTTPPTTIVTIKDQKSNKQKNFCQKHIHLLSSTILIALLLSPIQIIRSFWCNNQHNEIDDTAFGPKNGFTESNNHRFVLIMIIFITLCSTTIAAICIYCYNIFRQSEIAKQHKLQSRKKNHRQSSAKNDKNLAGRNDKPQLDRLVQSQLSPSLSSLPSPPSRSPSPSSSSLSPIGDEDQANNSDENVARAPRKRRSEISSSFPKIRFSDEEENDKKKENSRTPSSGIFRIHSSGSIKIDGKKIRSASLSLSARVAKAKATTTATATATTSTETIKPQSQQQKAKEEEEEEEEERANRNKFRSKPVAYKSKSSSYEPRRILSSPKTNYAAPALITASLLIKPERFATHEMSLILPNSAQQHSFSVQRELKSDEANVDTNVQSRSSQPVLSSLDLTKSAMTKEVDAKIVAPTGANNFNNENNNNTNNNNNHHHNISKVRVKSGAQLKEGCVRSKTAKTKSIQSLKKLSNKNVAHDDKAKQAKTIIKTKSAASGKSKK